MKSHHYILLACIGALVALVILLDWLGTILYLITIGFMAVRDLKQTKAPYDEKKRVFLVKSDWWETRWDDVSLWAFGGAIGAILANEIGVPLINKYAEMPELAELSLDKTVIVICTLLGAKILEKLLSK